MSDLNLPPGEEEPDLPESGEERLREQVHGDRRPDHEVEEDFGQPRGTTPPPPD